LAKAGLATGGGAWIVESRGVDAYFRYRTVNPGEGQVADLGPVRTRVLAAGDDVTGRAFTLAEFVGEEGA
jgi:hypothetical protein